ncbi:MAG TPA: TIGR03000 domain-containing protein [Gemmataceae bacterium]|jgi:uncharacterized protein (TIGR03000 family)|nr:TIGR03000 domain-containing protein [Gemmataceae bacterium]
MFRHGFFLLTAPAVLTLLLTPGPGAAQFYYGHSYGGHPYGHAYGYGGSYGYYRGYPGVGGFGRGYAYPGAYGNPYYLSPYYGLGLAYSTQYYASPAYYSPGYYAPQYSAPAVAPASYQSFYPPEANGQGAVTGDAPANVEVRLPAGAGLWFGSFRTDQTGSTRRFQSPPLTAGKDYTYEVRARWDQDGRPVEQTRTVQVRAGQAVRVDFLAAVPAAPERLTAPTTREDRALPPGRPAPPFEK